MKKLEMPYLLLITILGSVTITAVLAETDTTITTYPYVVTDGSNQRLVIISSGNVGISTTNPLTRLDLGPNPSLFLEGNGNQWGFTINSTDYGNGNVPLTFTSRGSGMNNEVMRITHSGNVGIGTNNPLTRLDLGPNPSLFLEGNGNQWGFTINSTDYGNGNVPLTFTSRGSGMNNEVMRITHSGNVGIGTTMPVQKLDVAGSINLAGNITSRTNNEFTITAPAGIPICIGTC